MRTMTCTLFVLSMVVVGCGANHSGDGSISLLSSAIPAGDTLQVDPALQAQSLAILTTYRS